MKGGEFGGAMLWTFILIIMLTFLGASFVTVSTPERIQSIRYAQRIQAYYFARSGAEMMRAWLHAEGYLSGGSTLDASRRFAGSLGGDGAMLLVESFGQDPEPIQITLENTPTGFTIVSTGTVHGMSHTITLLFEREPTQASPFTKAVFAVGQGTQANPAIQLDGSAAIEGPVGTNSTGQGSVVFGWSTAIRNGDLFIGSGGDAISVVTMPVNAQHHVPDGTIKTLAEEQTYPAPLLVTFPEGLSERGSFSAPGPEISEDGQYDTITVTGNRTVIIDLQNGTRRIRVRDFNLSQGHITLINQGTNGRLELYVENSFSVGGSSTLNSGGSSDQLAVYYAGTADPSFGGNIRLIGSLHLEQSGLSLSGSSAIHGHIISGSDRTISISGAADAQARIIYAPAATVTVGGSGAVKGAVIANRVRVSGSSQITFEQPDIASLPGGLLPEWLLTGAEPGQGQTSRRWTWR